MEYKTKSDTDSCNGDDEIEGNVETVRIDDIMDEKEYAVAIDKAIDKHFRRPKDLMIEPELVAYALKTHDYYAMPSADRVKLTRIRNEVESVQNAISKGIFLQGRNPDGAIEAPLCPICYNNLHERNPTSLIGCGHVYCGTCVTKILRKHATTSTKPKCPKCQTTFEPTQDLHHIHLFYK